VGLLYRCSAVTINFLCQAFYKGVVALQHRLSLYCIRLLFYNYCWFCKCLFFLTKRVFNKTWKVLPELLYEVAWDRKRLNSISKFQSFLTKQWSQWIFIIVIFQVYPSSFLDSNKTAIYLTAFVTKVWTSLLTFNSHSCPLKNIRAKK